MMGQTARIGEEALTYYLSSKRKNGSSSSQIINKLMILCSRLNPNSTYLSEIKNLLEADVNWNKLIKKASEEKVSPLLYHNLKKFQDKIPEWVMEHLKKMYIRNKSRNIYLYKKLKPLLKEINDCRLKVALTKGANLAKTLYKDIGLRYFTDIDFFLHPSDWPRFKKISEKLGFRGEGYGSSFSNFKMRKSGWPLATHLRKERLMLDSHFNYPGIETPLSSDNDIWESAQMVNIEGVETKIFSPEYELCILCLHAQAHSYNRIIWLTDIAELSSKKEINWNKILFICQKEEIRASVSYGLYLVNCFWPNTISKDILDRFILGKIEKKLLGFLWPEEKVLSRDFSFNTHALATSLFLIFSSRRLLLKLKILLSRVFPPLDWAAWRHKVPEDSIKVYIHYLRRCAKPMIFFYKVLFKA